MGEEMNDELRRTHGALARITYGLYVVSSFQGDRHNGQLANTVFQTTASPPRVAASLNKANLTHEFVLKSGLYAVSVLEQATPMPFIGVFGFKSGHTCDKCAAIAHKRLGGCPAVTEHALSIFTVRVDRTVDMGTHTLFIGEVTAAETLKDGVPLTYEHYRTVMRGKTQKNATTFFPEAK